MPLRNDIFKRHVIYFQPGQLDVVTRARELLAAVQGVIHVNESSPDQLIIHYDVRELSLQMIEQALADVGFTLSNKPLCKLKRWVIAYSEDAQRDSLGVNNDNDNAKPITLNEPDNHDPRPYHWRNYT